MLFIHLCNLVDISSLIYPRPVVVLPNKSITIGQYLHTGHKMYVFTKVFRLILREKKLKEFLNTWSIRQPYHRRKNLTLLEIVVFFSEKFKLLFNFLSHCIKTTTTFHILNNQMAMSIPVCHFYSDLSEVRTAIDHFLTLFEILF